MLGEFRAHLIECRALLVEYRALFVEYRALLIEYRDLFVSPSCRKVEVWRHASSILRPHSRYICRMLHVDAVRYSA